MVFPYVVPNQDGSGVVDAVGEGVDPARIGERVWLYFAASRRQHGTAAEWVSLPARQAVAMPNHVGFDLGASMGIPALTAHRALFWDGDIAGQTVLVSGGAGAVGHYAIELARRAGARVITTVSSSEKAAMATASGADIVIDYRQEDVAAAVRAVAPDGVDRIVEVALGANIGIDTDVLASHGTVVSYATDPADPVLDVIRLMVGNQTLRFLMIYDMPEAALQLALGEVSAALAAGDLTELPAHRFSLDEIVAAHEACESRAVGKVLIDLA